MKSKLFFIILLFSFIFPCARNSYAQSCGYHGGICCTTTPQCQNPNDVCVGNLCTPSGGSTPLPTGSNSNVGAIDFDKIIATGIPSLGAPFRPMNATDIGAIITLILPYLFVIAGLILLFMLIYGGFHMMVAANDQKGLQEAKEKITNALVGFLLLFISYWLIQILGKIFGVNLI